MLRPLKDTQNISAVEAESDPRRNTFRSRRLETEILAGVISLQLDIRLALLLIVHVPLLGLPCQCTARESSENVATLCSTVPLRIPCLLDSGHLAIKDEIVCPNGVPLYKVWSWILNLSLREIHVHSVAQFTRAIVFALRGPQKRYACSVGDPLQPWARTWLTQKHIYIINLWVWQPVEELVSWFFQGTRPPDVYCYANNTWLSLALYISLHLAGQYSNSRTPKLLETTSTRYFT